MPTLPTIEYVFYLSFMTCLAPDRPSITRATGPATPPARSWWLTAGEEAAAVAELQHAAGWAARLAECAGLALGYGEHQADAAHLPSSPRARVTALEPDEMIAEGMGHSCVSAVQVAGE